MKRRKSGLLPRGHWTEFITQFLTNPFSGGFAIMPKATISFVMSVRPSVRMVNSVLAPTNGFSWYLIFWYFFSRILQENTSLLIPDKNNRYFTCRPIYSLDHISLISSYHEKDFWQICTENQNTRFVFINVFPKIVPFMRWRWEI